MKYAKHLWWIIPLILILLVVASRSSDSGELAGVQKIPNMGNKHIETIDSEHEPYNSNPPTSGPHVGGLAKWGVSKEIIPDELQIHNLEDGGVIIQYNPDKLGEEDRARLESMAGLHKHMLVAPRYDMEHTIAVTAWNRLMPLDTVDETKIKAFVEQYAGIDHHVRSGF